MNLHLSKVFTFFLGFMLFQINTLDAQKNKKRIIVFKNEVCCVACYEPISFLLIDSAYKKQFLIANLDQSYIVEKLNLITKFPGLKNYDFIKDEKLFKKYKIEKTPHIIIKDEKGNISNWPYERIFCYSHNNHINDTLISILYR